MPTALQLVLLVAVIFAVLSTPLTVFLVIKYGNVGTPRDIAIQHADHQKEIKLRELTMVEEKHALEMQARKQAIDEYAALPPLVRAKMKHPELGMGMAMRNPNQV